MRITFRPLVLVLTFAVLLAAALSGRSRADTEPALDRQLVERLVRAQEAQVRATQELTRAVEHLKR